MRAVDRVLPEGYGWIAGIPWRWDVVFVQQVYVNHDANLEGSTQVEL